MRGVFITLEGGEAAGKSTQARLLAEALAARGYNPLQTREPGGSDGGERLRALLLAGDHKLSLHAEVLVHFASRFDHAERTIRPALERGQIVICDRFFDSTMAYQGYGLASGDPVLRAFITQLTDSLTLVPDLTLLLELPRVEARSRLARRPGAKDRYERLDEAFHQRVAAGFRAIADTAPERIRHVDASPDPHTVHLRVLHEVERFLGS